MVSTKMASTSSEGPSINTTTLPPLVLKHKTESRHRKSLSWTSPLFSRSLSNTTLSSAVTSPTAANGTDARSPSPPTAPITPSQSLDLGELDQQQQRPSTRQRLQNSLRRVLRKLRVRNTRTRLAIVDPDLPASERPRNFSPDEINSPSTTTALTTGGSPSSTIKKTEGRKGSLDDLFVPLESHVQSLEFENDDDDDDDNIPFEYILNPRFSEKYRVQELLGEGAFGFVCSATVVGTNRQVAVKFIEKEKLRQTSWSVDEQYGRIPNEVKILKSLNHPNIIRFIDYYDDDDYCYLITELHGTPWDGSNPLLSQATNPGLKKNKMSSSLGKLSGGKTGLKRRSSGDLFECIDAHAFIESKIAKRIFRQIIAGLTYLQKQGYVHKDIKDENILVDSDYNVKLADFGSCSPIPDVPAKYFRVFNGTVQYAAPEILCGSSYRGPEAEVWSCGALLFILLFNQNPFENPQQVIEKPLRVPLPVSRPCLNLLTIMLEKDPKQRATMDQVAAHPWITSDDDED